MTLPFRAALAALAFLALAYASASAGTQTLSYGGRELILFSPSHPPPAGSRALVIVLHGGLGNADHIHDGSAEEGLNLDALAEANGFYVAYLNGTQVAPRLPEKFKGWNAGNCCGLPASSGVDDVAYIEGAVGSLAAGNGIDTHRVFAIGHSNGAMMAQRLMCESDVLAAEVPISGALELDAQSCPAAKGKRILAIHGSDDRNVPVEGGPGRGLARVNFHSEANATKVFTASGANYSLDLVQGADHFLMNIDRALQGAEGVSIGAKAVAFFGLGKP